MKKEKIALILIIASVVILVAGIILGNTMGESFGLGAVIVAILLSGLTALSALVIFIVALAARSRSVAAEGEKGEIKEGERKMAKAPLVLAVIALILAITSVVLLVAPIMPEDNVEALTIGLGWIIALVAFILALRARARGQKAGIAMLISIVLLVSPFLYLAGSCVAFYLKLN